MPFHKSCLPLPPQQPCLPPLPVPQSGQGGLDGEEARVLEKRLDPSRNYYEVLGIPRCVRCAALWRTALHGVSWLSGSAPAQYRGSRRVCG